MEARWVDAFYIPINFIVVVDDENKFINSFVHFIVFVTRVY